MSRAATLDEVDARTAPLRREWGQQLVALGGCLCLMGEAMIAEDQIAGVLAGEGVAEILSALPLHIREVFLEYASDEAARGYLTDRRYLAAGDAA